MGLPDKYDREPDDFKEMVVHLLGNLPALKLFPRLDLPSHENFQFYVDGENMEWDEAVSKEYLKQLAEDRRIEEKKMDMD